MKSSEKIYDHCSIASGIWRAEHEPEMMKTYDDSACQVMRDQLTWENRKKELAWNAKEEEEQGVSSENGKDTFLITSAEHIHLRQYDLRYRFFDLIVNGAQVYWDAINFTQLSLKVL